MSVIPLDVARVEATIVDERLRAVETEFQSLAAQVFVHGRRPLAQAMHYMPERKLGTAFLAWMLLAMLHLE